MTGEELERLIRPLASPETQVVIDLLGQLYDVEWAQEWIGEPLDENDQYYRVILTPKSGARVSEPRATVRASRLLREHGARPRQDWDSWCEDTV